MVRWVFGSTPHAGPIELFLVPASAGVTKAVVCANQRNVLIRENSTCSGGSGFPLLLSGILPDIGCHITVNKMC